MSKQEYQTKISQSLKSFNFLRTNPKVEIPILEEVLKQIDSLNELLKKEI